MSWTEVPVGNDGFYWLWPGAYQIVLGDRIKMGENEAGWVIARSSIIRNGHMIATGLYDSGYEGPMIACLHIMHNLFKIKPDERIAQFICTKAESVKLYNGQYQGKG